MFLVLIACAATALIAYGCVVVAQRRVASVLARSLREFAAIRYSGAMVMTRSAKRPGQASTPEALAPVTAAWSQLRACLEHQSAALSEEVRNYPTPIARCDDQLPHLIEQRRRAIERLTQVADAEPVRSDSLWRAGLSDYLALSDSVIDDAQELALRARLKEALDRLPR